MGLKTREQMKQIPRRSDLAAPISLLALVLESSGCYSSDAYQDRCDWAEEIDVSEYVTGEGGVGGEWREVDSDNPLSFARLFLDSQSRPRYSQTARYDQLDTNYGISASSGTFYGCGSIGHRALVLLDPNRGSEGGQSAGNMLVDVSPYEEGNGYVLTHNLSSNPHDLLNDYSTQTLVYIHQVSENTIRYAKVGPDDDFDDYAKTLTRYSDDFPEELVDELYAPEGYLP